MQHSQILDHMIVMLHYALSGMSQNSLEPLLGFSAFSRRRKRGTISLGRLLVNHNGVNQSQTLLLHVLSRNCVPLISLKEFSATQMYTSLFFTGLKALSVDNADLLVSDEYFKANIYIIHSLLSRRCSLLNFNVTSQSIYQWLTHPQSFSQSCT